MSILALLWWCDCLADIVINVFNQFYDWNCAGKEDGKLVSAIFNCISLEFK